MLLDVFYQGGALVVACAAAFSISAAVGVIVAWAGERTGAAPEHAGRPAAARPEAGSGPSRLGGVDAAETPVRAQPLRVA